MARTVKDANLATGEARRRLEPRGKPYYRVIDEGLHIGYRKPQSSSGKWVMRCYTGKQSYKVEVIGIADDVSNANGVSVLSFSQAQQKARELRDQRDRTAAGRSGPLTVGEAMKSYLQWLEDEGKPTVDAKVRIDAFIMPALGDVRVDELTSQQVTRWRTEMSKMPARVRTRQGEPQRYKQQPDDDETRRRRRASTNRMFAILKAGLNRAFNGGAVSSDKAWRTVRLYKGVSSARVRYLTIDESKRLINACDPDFRNLVQAALLTGARYSELGRLQVTDFNPDVGTLTVRKSKSAKPRHVVLTAEGAKYFVRLCAGRAGSEVMLRKADGTAWRPSHQRQPMVETVARAMIKPAVSFHGLRHTWASHAVMNGMPLMVVAKNLGHRDTRMVELHYGHLAPSYVADEVRAKAPKYGLKASNVAAIR
jgi:integrase